MATIQTNLTCELQNGSVAVQYLNGVLFTQDVQGNQINVAVYDGGEPATISGTVSGNVIRSDGGTVAVTGCSISGNVASITLPAAAYAVPGVASIIVKLSTSGVVTTLAAVVANIYESSTSTAVDPGTIIPSVTALVAQIDTAVASIPADYSTLWTTLAPAFSTSTTYAAGQYVTYNGGLYRFTAAHTGNWSASDVVAANIGNDLSSLKSAFSTADNVSNFNNPVNIDYLIAGTGGYVQAETGEIISNSTYSYTNYIDLSLFVSIAYKRTGVTASNTFQGMAFYDANFNRVYGIRAATGQSANGYVAEPYELLVPASAKYARFSVYTNTESFGNFAITGISKLYNGNIRGQISASGDCNNAVGKGTYYVFNGASNAPLSGVDFLLTVEHYYLTKDIVSHTGRAEKQTAVSLDTRKRTFVRSRWASDPITTPGTWSAWVETSNQNIDVSHRLYKKNVLFIGDSITELGDFPARVATATGINAIKCGFGGCRMSTYGDDPYTGMCMSYIADNINSGDFDSLTQAAEDVYTRYGDDNRTQAALLAGLDYSTIDTIVIEYGTNDYAAGIPLGEPSDDSHDSFFGAINHIINKISSEYPEIRLLFVSPIWRSSGNSGTTIDSDIWKNAKGLTLPDYVGAMAQATKLNHVQFVDMYANSGINKYTADYYLVDGLHPVINTGYQHYADLIVKALIDGAYSDHSAKPEETELVSFKNDMQNDGIPVDADWAITVNGTASADNYGQPNAKYEIRTKPCKLWHVYFEYQFTEGLPVNGEIPLFSAYDETIKVVLFNQGMRFANNYIDKIVSVGQHGDGAGSASTAYEKGFQGTKAFSVRYTGNKTGNTDLVMVLSDSSCVIKHSTSGTIVSTVSFNSTDSVKSLVESINAITDISCVAYEVANHTCAELMTDSSVSIALVNTFTNDLSQTITDAPKIFVPYEIDKSWHTLEILINENDLTCYVAFDGRTSKQAFRSDRYETAIGKYTKQTFTIGGSYNNAETPIKVRNLEVDYNSAGTAEIVTSVSYPYTSNSSTQMVSEHNPKLLLFEGHGIFVGMDGDISGEATEDMDVTTDRLQYLFDYLNEKGYVPVTWHEIIDWKINGAKLPKRCYTIMFDDWRFENYVNYQKRIVFEKYNVRPGLAVITGQKTPDETETIDGNTYTVAKIVDMVEKAGWYPCSHTENHRYIYNYSNEELYPLIKNDVLSCNSLGIYSDIIVYPYGAYNARYRAAFEDSGFKLGVDVVKPYYNCRALSDFSLARVEIARYTLEQVLLSIV